MQPRHFPGSGGRIGLLPRFPNPERPTRAALALPETEAPGRAALALPEVGTFVRVLLAILELAALAFALVVPAAGSDSPPDLVAPVPVSSAVTDTTGFHPSFKPTLAVPRPGARQVFAKVQYLWRV